MVTVDFWSRSLKRPEVTLALKLIHTGASECCATKDHLHSVGKKRPSCTCDAAFQTVQTLQNCNGSTRTGQYRAG